MPKAQGPRKRAKKKSRTADAVWLLAFGYRLLAKEVVKPPLELFRALRSGLAAYQKGRDALTQPALTAFFHLEDRLCAQHEVAVASQVIALHVHLIAEPLHV